MEDRLKIYINKSAVRYPNIQNDTLVLKSIIIKKSNNEADFYAVHDINLRDLNSGSR